MHFLLCSDGMRIVLDEEECQFEKYRERFPAKEITDRGEKFFHRHPANYLLAEDVKSGLAYELRPELLHKHRQEYQEFPLRTFRKRIHQEKEKQRADPYWRHKRNIAAMFKLMKEREVNKKEWIDSRVGVEIEEAGAALAQIGRLD